MKYIAILIGTLALAGSAFAGDIPTHQGQSQSVVLSFRAQNAPQTITSNRLVPASLPNGQSLQAGMRFNGHQAQACWQDTVQQFECAWRGVIVIVQLHKHAAPMIVRVASTRYDAVKVRLSLSW